MDTSLPETGRITPVSASPSRGMRGIASLGWSLGGFAIIVAVWQAAVMIGKLPEVLLPGPLAVFNEIIAIHDVLIKNGLVTLREILIGFFLAIAVGFPLAIAIAFSRPLERVLYPVLIVSNAVPKVAIAPLFLIWFGFGGKTNAILALLTAVFPVVINTALGLTELNPDLVKLGKVMGGSPLRVFWYIRLPAALPSIFAGLKVSITLATIGAIVGELVAGQEGLGYLAQYAAGQLKTNYTFACIVVLSLLGVALFYLMVYLENVTIRWRPPVVRS
jgi:NitT/TauT family transport system permease protein